MGGLLPGGSGRGPSSDPTIIKLIIVQECAVLKTLSSAVIA